MDPKLIAALRKMLVAQKRATAAGAALSAYDLDAFVREETGGKHGLDDAKQLLTSINTDVGPRNLGRSAVQGATFDFGDELLGLLPEAVGGGENAKDEMRLRQDLFREQHPYADAGAGMAGSLGLALLLTRGKGPASVPGSIGQGAALGAASGAVAGLGRGEGSLADRAPGAIVPALLGAGLGAAVPTLAGSLKVKLSPTLRATRRVTHAIEESGGPEAVAAQNAEMNLAGRGQHAMLGDLSDRLRLETDFAVNNSDDALAKIAPEVADRGRNASGRLLEDTRTVLGGNPRAAARMAELKGATRQVGDDAFSELRASNPTVAIAPETAATLKDPVVSAALKEAQRTGLIGPVKDTGAPSFQHLQDVKETLDDAISAAFKAGRGNLGSRLKKAREVVVAELEKVNGYTEATSKYAAAKKSEKALEAGVKAWGTEDTEELARAVGSMSSEALEEFRTGLASKLISKLRSTKTNRDAAKELMDASIATNDKLKVVFGTKENFDRYMFRVGKEAQLGKMKGVFGNSATQRRAQAAGFDPMEMGVGMAEGGAPSPVSLIQKLYAAGHRPLQRATAKRVGEMTSIKGTQNISDFLETITNPEPLLGRLTGKALPVAMGGLLKY